MMDNEWHRALACNLGGTNGDRNRPVQLREEYYTSRCAREGVHISAVYVIRASAEVMAIRLVQAHESSLVDSQHV